MPLYILSANQLLYLYHDGYNSANLKGVFFFGVIRCETISKSNLQVEDYYSCVSPSGDYYSDYMS